MPAAVVTAHYPPPGEWAILLSWIDQRAMLTALSHTQCAHAPELNWAAVVPNAVDVVFAS
jgi:hypothetical protein